MTKRDHEQWPALESSMHIRQAIAPLTKIFWGAILVLIDVSFSSATSIGDGPPRAFRFDVLNDFVGMVLITLAVRTLAGFATNSSDRQHWTFIYVCAALNSVRALTDHLVFEPPLWLGILWSLLSVISTVAVVLFCRQMIRVSRAHRLERAATSWQTTLILAISLWLISVAIIEIIAIWFLLTDRLALELVVPVFVVLVLCALIPAVHFLLSTSRMREDIERLDQTQPEFAHPG